jgi:anti-sigma factor RsiW
MAESEQDQVMDAKLIAERQVIERYLAGQLSDAEADAFEARLESQPELARDVEQIARMKTGFAVLERRGELAKLLAHPVAPPNRRAPWLAAAAAVFVGAIGFLVFRQAESPAPAALLAVSLDALSRHSESPIPLRASVSLARARGMGADAELNASAVAPGAAELELATGDAARTHYSVELLAIDSAGARAVAKLPDAAADDAGILHLFVSLHAVKPGPYLLRLTPTGDGTPVEYSIAVRPAH